MTAADTALADQVQAASRDTGRLVARLEGPLDGDLRTGIPTPDWIRTAVDRHNQAWAQGRGLACEHAGQPQIYHVALWLPGLTVCGTCAAAGALECAPDEQWICDRCRQEHPHAIALSTAHLGMHVAWFGLCSPCREATR